MTDDPIVAEVRRIREQIVARAGYDVRALVAAAQRRQREGDKRIISRPSRRSPQGLGAV